MQTVQASPAARAAFAAETYTPAEVARAVRAARAAERTAARLRATADRHPDSKGAADVACRAEADARVLASIARMRLAKRAKA